jgi:hypothetical protein
VKRLAIPALLAVSALGALASPARADEASATSYAVVSFDVSGTDDTLRAKVEAGLQRGAAEAGADIVTYEDVQKALSGKPALAGCVSPSCLAGIADVVGTDQFLELTVTANGANYDLTISLVGTAGVVRRRTGSCTVCTVSDLSDLAATRVTDLLTATAGQPQAVSIGSQPDGATLDIPGIGSAPAPWSGELPPGSLTIGAHLPGYHDARQDITVVDDGSDQHFDITLTALPPPPPKYHLAKWITAGGALAGLVTGGILLAMDGDGTCGSGHGTCPRQYSTGVAGAVFGILGLGAGGGAAYMFHLDGAF